MITHEHAMLTELKTVSEFVIFVAFTPRFILCIMFLQYYINRKFKGSLQRLFIYLQYNVVYFCKRIIKIFELLSFLKTYVYACSAYRKGEVNNVNKEKYV